MISRRLGVFTGNRAEYGLLVPLIREIKIHPAAELVLIVSGAHLNDVYGRSVTEIQSDGFSVDLEIEIPEPVDGKISTGEAIGVAIASYSKEFSKLGLDGIFIYADRYEGFAATVAASQSNIPVFHIEGGDLTEGGAFDDNIRHSMTKLSHLHLPSNNDARKRIIAMGEEPWRVKNVGLLTDRYFLEHNYSSRDEIETFLGMKLKDRIIICTHHSISSCVKKTMAEITELISALKIVLDEKDASVIFTYPNDDQSSNVIIEEIFQLSKLGFQNLIIKKSLGRRNYHGLLALNDLNTRVVCLGNSSSFIKETVYFGNPAILVGSRQDSRLSTENVIRIPAKADVISETISIELKADHKSVLENPYAATCTISDIVDFVVAAISSGNILQKKNFT